MMLTTTTVSTQDALNDALQGPPATICIDAPAHEWLHLPSTGHHRVWCQGQSRVVAGAAARLIAEDESQVWFIGRSHGLLLDRAHGLGWGRSCIEARDNTTVTGFEHCRITAGPDVLTHRCGRNVTVTGGVLLDTSL